MKGKKTTRFGVPYKGSKNGIVRKILPYLPMAKNFYDLFAGGCAMTHAALLTSRYDHFYANDLQGDGLKLFLSAIRGDFKNEKRWISRQDFEKMKNSDPYVSLCWSFGNNQRDYMYAAEIEPWKLALHYARMYHDTSLFGNMGIPTDGSCADIINHEKEYKRLYIRWWLSRQKYSKEELDELIDRCKGNIKVHEEELRQYLVRALKASGLTQSEVQRRLGTQMAGHYFGKSQWAFPTEEHYRKMQTFMPLPKDYNEIIGLRNLWQRLQSLESLESLQRLQRLQSLESLQSLQRLQRLQSLQSLERLQSLESLQRLQRLERLERLEATYLDYRAVEIKPDSVIYCDPPYIGTDEYGCEGEVQTFDHAAFYDWCCKQNELVIISEYRMPMDRFACIDIFNKQTLLGSASNGKVRQERLFVPRHQLTQYIERMKKAGD